MCEKLGIDRVNQADGRIDMRFALNAQVDGQKLFTALNLSLIHISCPRP